jgi:D-alanyl-D-alanine carboxypeptidase
MSLTRKGRTPSLPVAVGALAALLLVPPAVGVQAAAAAPAPVAAGVAPAAARPTHAELQAIMDSVTSDTGSSITAELIDEQGRWTPTSGVAQIGKHGAPPADGRFRVGSITKTFVATVMLQLVSEGRLSLDDSVEHWLPGLVPGGDKITVRQLLNHTSGIFNYTDDQKALPLLGQKFLDESRFRTYTPLELVKIATAHPPNFAPGTAWAYSNTNYILAAMILEKVTGHSWRDEVTQRIIGPLGLKNTTLPGTSKAIPGPHAHGYTIVYDGRKVQTVDVSELNPSWAGSAGEIISTTADLDQFYTALFGGQLLKPAELAAMKTTVDTGVGFRYGLALMQIPLPCGSSIWGHNGGIPGYATVSLHSEDGTRHLTASLTPLFERANLNELALTFFCGTQAPSTPTPAPMSVPAIF